MSSPLKPVADALYTAMIGDAAFNAAMTAGVYFQQFVKADGSPAAAFPYAVFSFVSDITDYTYTGKYPEVLVQIAIFERGGNGKDADLLILNHIDKLHTLFDNATLAVAGWTFLSMLREGHILRVPDDQRVRQSVSTYRIRLYKQT